MPHDQRVRYVPHAYVHEARQGQTSLCRGSIPQHHRTASLRGMLCYPIFFLFLCEHMQAARGSSGRQIAVGALRDLRWWSGNQVGLVQECQRPRATMSAHYGETFEAPAGMMHCMSLMHDGCFVGIMPDATVSPPSPQCSWPRALSDSWTRDGLGAWCGVVLSMHEVWPAPGKTNSRATKCHCLELDTVRLKAIGQVKPHPISTSRRKSALRP